MNVRKLLLGVLPVGLLAWWPSSVFAAANLQSDDFVGISFWLISMALMASTVFFLWETQSVDGKWKTSPCCFRSGNANCGSALFLHERRVGSDGRDTNRLSLH